MRREGGNCCQTEDEHFKTNQTSSRIQITEFRGAAGNGAQKPARASQNKLIDPPPLLWQIVWCDADGLVARCSMRQQHWAQHKTGLVNPFFFNSGRNVSILANEEAN